MDFTKKVKAFLKLDDDSKIKKFQRDNLKELKNQISIRKDEMKDIEEKISEKNEELEEQSLNVDLERIKTVTERKSYLVEYNGALLVMIEEIDALKEELESKTGEIERFQRVVSLLGD